MLARHGRGDTRRTCWYNTLLMGSEYLDVTQEVGLFCRLTNGLLGSLLWGGRRGDAKMEKKILRHEIIEISFYRH